MNRQQEYWELIQALKQTPPQLDGTAARAKARAKRRRARMGWRISLGTLAGICACFVLAVNALPTFAQACAKVPVLRELAAAVAFSPSLSGAVSHDYVQQIGQSQTRDGLTLTLESVVADRQQMVVFYRTDGSAPYTSVSCTVKGPDGQTLTGYAVTSGQSGEELKRFEIHFTGMETPDELTLELRLCETDLQGESTWLEPVYTFPVRLDPDKTAAPLVLPIGQWVELDGQRLLVDRLEITPTKTALYLEDDPHNAAWLQNLFFHITAPDGTVYDTVDSAVSAIGRADGEGVYTYYFQSLYFVERPEELTLWIDRALWLDKGAQGLTLNLTDGSVQGALPPTVEELSVEQAGDGGREIRLTTAAGRPPLQMGYRDPDGGSHTFDGLGADRQGEDPTREEFYYLLEDCLWPWVEVEWSYTQVTDLEEPLAVPLTSAEG